jgi:HK97 gp10 family phage protein
VSLTVRWHTAALHNLLEGEHGPVARYLDKIGTKVESQAKKNASGRPGPNVDTGRLRSSITHVLGSDEDGVYVDIGTNVEYGKYLEHGTVYMPPYPFLEPALSAIHE